MSYRNVGIAIRAGRIFNRKTKKVILVPMDHGFSEGAMEGIEDIACAVEKVVRGGANCVVVHKGHVADGLRDDAENDVGLMIHLSGSSAMGKNRKRLICTVKEAAELGADAVSIQVNIGSQYEHEMLDHLAQVGREARDRGIPLMVMIYVRGSVYEKELKRVSDEARKEAKKQKLGKAAITKAVKAAKEAFRVDAIIRSARLANEANAAIIKCPFTGDQESFKKLTSACSVPVVIAGGPKMDTDRDVLQLVYDAMVAGAAGTSIGRNVFQHKNVEKMVAAMAKIVHEGGTVDEAMEILNAA